MKGVINRGMQGLVEAKFGTEAWEEIRMLAGCDELFFVTGENYPDQRILGLVEAAAKVSGLTPEEVLIELGKHWVLKTGKESYPAYYSLAGASPREFLKNLDRLHRRAARDGGGPDEPRLRYEEFPDGRLLIHYHSSGGFCPVLKGVILGVGILFDQDITVREIACSKRGNAHCTMEVLFS